MQTSSVSNSESNGSGRDGTAPATKGARQAAMAALAHATATELQTAWTTWPGKPAVETLRGPETGLVMLRGRIGGGGAPFNMGEATVTRATVRLDNGLVGHAYALGRDAEKVRLAAIFDALWQDEALRDQVETDVLVPLRQRISNEDTKLRAEAAATKVDFFTMVRGDN